MHFNQLVDQVLERLPRAFKEKLHNLAIIVEDFPDEELQEQFEGTLLGLFQGVPKTRETVFWASPPSQIRLFQKNIESLCRTDEQIRQQIEKTLKHEIGHYFGLSERDLRKKGY